jgi:peptidyl-prolyl cis-trans isomerase D
MVLQSIRDRLTGIIAIFIFAILIIPFAFVGVSSYFQSDAVNAVALVNDQEITIGEFNSQFQNYRRRMQAQLGDAFDPVAFDQPIIRRQFLDQMIDEELLAQVALDAGLAVDNQYLAQSIREMAGFQVDGEFNADVYQARLAAQGMTPKQFEAEMRASILLGQFPSAIGTSAIATDWEAREYARLIDQQRSFRAIVVPAFPEAETAGPEGEDSTAEEVTEDTVAEGEASGEEPAAVSDDILVEEEAVVAWYEDHLVEYMSDEQVSIEYLELDAATIGGAVEPEEEVLRARFEQQESRFITPESRLASHILIELDASAPEVEVETARQQAEALAERARAGEDFAELARENSQDLGSSEDGGDLGWVEPGFMVQAFEDGLYELTLESPISDPVQTGFGWHVIYLREIRPSEGMSYTEAREILVEEYIAEADERRFLEQADRLVDIIYEDPTTLDAAANELGLEVREAGPFGRAGDDSFIGGNMEVVTASFSDLVLGQGVVSDPIDLGENHIVLVRLKEHLPQAQLPLEEVREQVVASVRQQIGMERASATAESLLGSLQGGADIAELANSEGLELVESEDTARRSPLVDARLRDEVFLLERPDDSGPVLAVVELDNGYAAVQLNSVTDGELTNEDEMRKRAYMRRGSISSGNTETIGFLKMLRDQSVIEVYEDRL